MQPGEPGHSESEDFIMAYNDNPMNNRDNNDIRNNDIRNNRIRNESEEQRTRRQNRVGLVILAIAVLAFVGGFAATMDKRNVGVTETPTTASNTAPTGNGEAAIAPAAGNATASTSGDMTGTGVNSTPQASGDGTNTAANNTSGAGTAATTATATPSTTGSSTGTGTTGSGSATEPATANPKVYTSEESCRGSTNGACQPIAGGWTSVNPAPDRTAVPEAMSPASTGTTTGGNGAD
jgi:hypothetical protein